MQADEVTRGRGPKGDEARAKSEQRSLWRPTHDLRSSSDALELRLRESHPGSVKMMRRRRNVRL